MTHANLWVMDSWVPVERRWLGLDRRTVWPAVTVLAIAILLRWLLPLADNVVPHDEVIRPGDRFNLDQGLTVAPPVGWTVTDGILVGARTVTPGTGSPTAAVVSSGVSANIQVAPFDGNADALLDQIDRNDERSGLEPGFVVDGGRAAVTATGSVTGVVERYSSNSVEGLIAAFTFADGRGMAIQVDASADQFTAHTSAIDAMLRSVAVAA